MARKYYHARGVEVVRDFHDGHGAGHQLVATCATERVAGKVAAKLNAADEFDYALRAIGDGMSSAAGYAHEVWQKANSKTPNHH